MTPLARLVQVQKAIGHPVRMRMLRMLADGPLCGCQISAVVKLAASTVSEHLSELRRAGIVAERKEGRWVEYRVTEEARESLARLFDQLDEDDSVRADAVVARVLRRVPLEELCSVDLDLRRLGRPAVDAAVDKAERIRASGAR